MSLLLQTGQSLRNQFPQAFKKVTELAVLALESNKQQSLVCPLETELGRSLFRLVGFTSTRALLSQEVNSKVGIVLFWHHMQEMLQLVVCRRERALDLSVSTRVGSDNVIEPTDAEVLEQIAEYFPIGLRVIREMVHSESREFSLLAPDEGSQIEFELQRLCCNDKTRRVLERHLRSKIEIEWPCHVTIRRE